MRARAGDPAVPARSQASLAVSSDGIRWSLLNASPDIRAQLQGFPALCTELVLGLTDPIEPFIDVAIEDLARLLARADGPQVLNEASLFEVTGLKQPVHPALKFRLAALPKAVP